MRRILRGVIPALSLLLACAAPRHAVTEEGRTVLLIVNENSRESIKLAGAYRAGRGVPDDNVVLVGVDPVERIPRSVYDERIERPVRDALKRKPGVKYLLTFRGVPLRVNEKGYSIDSLLGAMDLKPREVPIGDGNSAIFAENPYFRKDEPFSPAKFGFRIACRIDGPTYEDAMALLERGRTAKMPKGPFLLDRSQPKGPGFDELNDAMTTAEGEIRKAGGIPALDTESAMATPSEPVAGYVTWGSNDPKWDEKAYRSVRFLPGAIAETFVSTSARTFGPVTEGQSRITDLLVQGVTGVKGYVTEPYVFALARPEILFPRYLKGYTLGESFCMASPVLKWKDVILGDPLCRPFAK